MCTAVFCMHISESWMYKVWNVSFQLQTDFARRPLLHRTATVDRIVHCSLSHAPIILCHFSDWLPKCGGTPGVTFICSMLRSCDILTMLWQHDENIMLDRSASAVSCSLWSLFFVCGRYHSMGPPHVRGYLFREGSFVIKGPNHLFTWTPAEKWDPWLCFNQIGF